MPATGPVADDEIDAFLQECSITRQELVETLLTSDLYAVVSLSIDDLEQFRSDVEQWSFNANWMNADGPFFPLYSPLRFAPERAAHDRYSDLSKTAVEALRRYSPSIAVLKKLVEQRIDLDKLHWRELERLVAELLELDGYRVELGRGSKDGGADILAYRELPGIGPLKCVWQAKHLSAGNKVGLRVVRELADVRNEFGASKAIIVTTSFLTKDAVERVTRDQYTLGKVERPELDAWIQRTVQGRR